MARARPRWRGAGHDHHHRPHQRPPAADATLAPASASASGRAAVGSVCGVSADGGGVLFSSPAINLASGDVTANPNGLAALFVKDFNGNGVTRVATGLSRNGLPCRAFTPNANAIFFVDEVPVGTPNVRGFDATEPAIMVKNLGTGVRTRVTPPLATFSNVDRYEFAGVSDDGLRVAFIAQPARTCSGFDCTANGPARMLLRDVATGQRISLERQVRFTTSQGVVDGDALLSPGGRTLAFTSRVDYPEAGDAVVGSDVDAVNLASGNVRLVNTDAAGRQLGVSGPTNPNYAVQAFLSNGSKVVLFISGDTSAGRAGVYLKDLAGGAINRVLDPNLTYSVGSRSALSFSDDARKVAYIESTGNSQTGTSVARVRDVATGALVNAATLGNDAVGNGPVITAVWLSRDGRAAALANHATNLVAGANSAEQRVYRKLFPRRVR